jgi:membrane-bound metal-dependent hydrolase YbcI (DUF457 family)
MFNSTHTLVGLAMVRTGFDRWSRHATWTAVLASNLPDIDILAGLYGMPAYLEHHRGITHSIVGIPLLSLALAGAMYRFTGNVLKTFVIAALAMSTHLALDYLNTYGVRPFLPFNEAWYYGDALFIIDPILDLTLIAVLVAGRLAPTRRRQLAAAGLAAVALYVGLRMELRNLALSNFPADKMAAVSPMALDPFRWLALMDYGGGVTVVGVSPFKGIIGKPISFGRANVDDVITQAARSRSAQAFHAFARFRASNVKYQNSQFVVTFYDLRYYNGETALGARVVLDRSLKVLEESLRFNQPLD